MLKIFNKYLSDHYSECESTNFNNRHEVLALLHKNEKTIDLNLGHFLKTHLKQNCQILDLGCGYGNFLYFLQKRHFQNVTGVDLSAEEITLCRTFFKSYQLYQADILKYISTTSKKFDLIYLSHVLEHIKKESLIVFLKNIKKKLKKNGLLIIIVPNSAAYFNSSANRYGDITHQNGFTDISIKQILKLAEFKYIDVKNYFGIGHTKIIVKLIRKITLLIFNLLLQVLGYDKQNIYTPSLLTIAKKKL